MSGGPEDIEQKIAALKKTYVAALPAKVAEIEAAAEAVGGEPSSEAGRAAVETLEFLAHKLAGSGGTYGLPAVGSAAEDVERACTAVLDAPTAEGWDAVPGLIATLHSVVEALPTDD